MNNEIQELSLFEATMTEREMLELAARAFGRWGDRSKYIESVYDYDSPHCGSSAIQWDEYSHDTWNPLINDGDCARMESALRIFVSWGGRIVQCSTCDICEEQLLRVHGGDRMAARRMASLKVAAAIGKAMT